MGSSDFGLVALSPCPWTGVCRAAQTTAGFVAPFRKRSVGYFFFFFLFLFFRLFVVWASQIAWYECWLRRKSNLFKHLVVFVTAGGGSRFLLK